VQRRTVSGTYAASLHYAWRAERGPQALGKALAWWLGQLAGSATRRALLDRDAGRIASA
jgi:hypothetical protein